jgi:3-oxoacyl-[acyl-carrier protein] reductase
MSGVFSDQVVIVTGAGRGIGGAAAKLFGQEGASVVVSDLDAAPAEQVAGEIVSAGGKAIAVAGDVTDPAFPENLMKTTIDTYGKLHVLVNNAGYTWDGMLHKMTDKQWAAMLEVHNTAPFRLIRAATPYLRDAGKADLEAGKTPEPRCIINVSSTSGLHGNIGQINYATAKMGIVGLTKTVAKEWGKFGVRCNAVAFGYIDTRLTRDKQASEKISVEGEEIQLGIPEAIRQSIAAIIPMGRSGTAEEAAGGILLLASPWASYINGHTLEVTGGMGI